MQKYEIHFGWKTLLLIRHYHSHLASIGFIVNVTKSFKQLVLDDKLKGFLNVCLLFKIACVF